MTPQNNPKSPALQNSSAFISPYLIAQQLPPKPNNSAHQTPDRSGHTQLICRTKAPSFGSVPSPSPCPSDQRPPRVAVHRAGKGGGRCWCWFLSNTTMCLKDSKRPCCLSKAMFVSYKSQSSSDTFRLYIMQNTSENNTPQILGLKISDLEWSRV